MEQSKAMECGSRKASSDVVKPHYIYIIRFLNAINVLPSEIHHQICQVYGDNALYVCVYVVLYESQNKQQLRAYAPLTEWFL